jgi:hypothetical protein
MVGFVLSSFTVLYGLLVGLIAVSAYQNVTNVSAVVSKEASSLGAIYRDLAGYPQPTRGRLRDKLRDYTRYEIERDWLQLRKGIVPAEGTHRLGELVDDLLRFAPQHSREEIVHIEVLEQLNTFLVLRQTRLDSVTTGLPEVVWWVVGAGALIIVLLISLLAMEIHVHLILGAALSGFLGLVIFLIAIMDHPLRGHMTGGAEPFQEVYKSLMLPDDAVNSSLATLISAAGKLGRPRIEGTIPVAGKSVPGLYFGAHLVNNSNDLVDEIAREKGGVASIFVKSGDEYVRVSTNALATDRSRAIGTVLDPQGPAIQMIRKGQAYYGDAMAVGSAYITGYEPMKDAKGQVIGIYCTAYLKR